MWAKLDDGFLDHRKVFIAGDAIGKNGPAIAIGFYSIGLMYANKHLTDGRLPAAVVKQFHHVERPLVVAAALVEAGLWDVVDGGYQIHDFHDHNFSAAQVKSSREWDRRRKALYSDVDLVEAVRARDRGRCRYCGVAVNWKDRRGATGGQFDHVEPRGPNTVDNIVVACRGCNNRKHDRSPEEAGMVLLPPGSKGAVNGSGTA
jgi:hypothetical protein